MSEPTPADVRRKERELRITARQHALLHIVETHGPITPADVHYHGFTVSESAARASLSRLERRKLVEAEYTTSSGCGRAYVVTVHGASVLAMFDAEHETEADHE